MNKTFKKLLVLTSGGDAPGMNAAIRGVVRAGIHYGLEVYGSNLGYRGIIARDIVPMGFSSVKNCIQRGGTILGTRRYPEFKGKAVRDQARAVLQEIGIDCMVVIGGDGTFRGAYLLHQEGGPACIGIPGTIDNDINGTDYTLGFDTACNTALDAIDKIRDTASSHHRHFIVEVMGRSSGFLAAQVGLSGGAEYVLIPERPVEIPDLVRLLKEASSKKSSSIMIVAEADHPGRSMLIAEEIKKISDLEYKVCILGHIQRGGSPTVKDRTVGSMMGVKSVEALLAGETGKMAAIQDGHYVFTSFPDLAHAQRTFEDFDLLEANNILCGFRASAAVRR